MLAVAEAEHALLRARLLLVAPRAAERRVETMLVERLAQRLRLHDVGVLARAVGDRVHAGREAFLIEVDQEVEPEFLRDILVAEPVHVAELPGRVDVEERERRLRRVERLHREVQEHRRVLADRVEEDGLLEAGGDLAEDVDRLCLEFAEMAQTRAVHAGNPQVG